MTVFHQIVGNVTKLETSSCNKFEGCSAPVCPLWRPISRQKMGRDERVCFYLLEYQKTDSKTTFEGAGLSSYFEIMAESTAEIYARPDLHRHLIKTIQKAAKTGSRILAGKKLNA